MAMTRIRARSWLACMALLSTAPALGCVRSSTHQRTLDQLARARSEQDELLERMRLDAERRDRAEQELQAELERTAASLAETEQTTRQLEGQLTSVVAENRRLETLLSARGEEARRLQARLNALSAIETEIRERNRIYEEVIGRFRSLIDGGQLSVSIVRGRLVINLPQDILFESGSAVLGREGRETLATVAAVLSELDDRRFQVEGHTDNVPIATARFPSNWELSTARAVSVVDVLVDRGVPPSNLSGAGYGEFQPVASNDSREGRRLNRRIEIVMLPNLDVIATAAPGG